jgi:hypothetical protein
MPNALPDPSPADIEQVLERQRRLAELLNCAPDRIEHDVRNLLNELNLLRTLFDAQENKK